MTTSLTDRAALPARRSRGVRNAIRFGLASGALATLLLTGAAPAAVAQQSPGPPTANRVYANCQLGTSSGGQNINTVAGLQRDILANNPSGANSIKIQNPPQIAYVVIYAINNDNNGQVLVSGPGAGTPTGFTTGPVICVNPLVVNPMQVKTALQTGDIANVDILDVQDALILRHAPTGSATPGRNRICHTTDGTTDCFDIPPRP